MGAAAVRVEVSAEARIIRGDDHRGRRDVGYWVMGSTARRHQPGDHVVVEMTEAKMGRWIKRNRDMDMVRLPPSYARLGGAAEGCCCYLPPCWLRVAADAGDLKRTRSALSNYPIIMVAGLESIENHQSLRAMSPHAPGVRRNLIFGIRDQNTGNPVSVCAYLPLGEPEIPLSFCQDAGAGQVAW